MKQGCELWKQKPTELKTGIDFEENTRGRLRRLPIRCKDPSVTNPSCAGGEVKAQAPGSAAGIGSM